MRMRACGRIALGFTLAVIVAAAPGVSSRARAAEPALVEGEQSARRSFQKGETHFRAGRFADALPEYEAGYAASPLPGFLINIAQCQRRLGDLKIARTTYQKFVMVAPDSPLVPEVNTLIEELDRLAGAEEENATRTATIPSAEAGPLIAAIPIAKLTTVPPPSVLPSAGGAAPAVAAPSRTRWWLWGTMAVAVVGGTVAVFAMRSPEMETLDAGTLGTLRR